MIDFKNVCFGYEKNSAIVNDVSFHINKGDFTAIIGANGAGKSTLSKLFNGLHIPQSGVVTINGMNTKTTKTSILAKHIGFLFQNPDRQICCNTVRDEILFGLQCVCSDKNTAEKRADDIIEKFEFDSSKNPFSLSRGERQKLTLISLIAVEPEIMILDEPTTGLDYKECMSIMSIISELNKKGTTVIMISHDMEIVLDFARHVLVMANGKIIADGETRDIFQQTSALDEACVMPPQISGLAQSLGKEFDGIFTVDEMTERIKYLLKEKE